MSADRVEYTYVDAVSYHLMINIHIPIVQSYNPVTMILLSMSLILSGHVKYEYSNMLFSLTKVEWCVLCIKIGILTSPVVELLVLMLSST